MNTKSHSLNPTNPLLIVISGPSGVGKDTVLSKMKGLAKPYHFTVTATTRPMRSTEQNGVDYIFVTKKIFCKMIESGEFLEWAKVHGNHYGIPRQQILDAMKNGNDIIVKPDIQGAETIKKIYPNAILIFLAPSDINELSTRLTLRRTESSSELKARLKTAKREMRKKDQFDYVVVNHHNKIDGTIKEIETIIHKEKTRKINHGTPIRPNLN